MLPDCKSVFITGSNRGIGLELVKQFLRLPKPPMHIFASCRSLQSESASELRYLASTAPSLHLIELDVNNMDAIQRTCAEVDKVLGHKGLNLLINNAGIMGCDSLDKVSKESMMENFQTHCVAPLMTTKLLLPYIKRAASQENGTAPRAAIANISSILGSIAENNEGSIGSIHGGYPYRASKCALNAITKNLSVDLREDGICAIVLHPGWVKTDIGGPMASLTTTESVSGMMSVIGSLDLGN